MIENNAQFWRGLVKSAGRDSLTVEGEPFNSDLIDNSILIFSGRGLGQYRRVISHTGNTLKVSPAWDIVPDETTYFKVSGSNVEWLWLDNTDEHTANWTGFWGNNYGHVVDGHINRGGDGLYLWGVHNERAVAFVDIIGSWVSYRGNIVLQGNAPVFGNSVYRSEVTGFRHRPSQHGTVGWAHPHDSRVLESRRQIVERTGVLIADGKLDDTMPGTTPLRDWNIVERVLVTDGPRGIYVAPASRYTVLERNVISVDGPSLLDEGHNTIQGRLFDGSD